MTFTDIASSHLFVEHAVALIARTLIDTTSPQIALCGGSTPASIYHTLGTKALPFEHARFYQVDERYVPADHPDANRRMIQEQFASQVSSTFYWIDTSLPINKVVDTYAKIIDNHIFDLCILGIGPDGHFASLFPETFQNPLPHTPVLHTTTSQFAVQDRISLHPETIMKSRRLLVLLQGAQKKTLRTKLASLSLQTPLTEFPARMLLDHPDCTVLWCPTDPIV